jgi:hypothetical protein
VKICFKILVLVPIRPIFNEVSCNFRLIIKGTWRIDLSTKNYASQPSSLGQALGCIDKDEDHKLYNLIGSLR